MIQSQCLTVQIKRQVNYMLSAKKHTSNMKTLVELCEFSKPVGHKVNIQIPIALLYISNTHWTN